MKYCVYCLNHGMNFWQSIRHSNDCPFSECQCHKCRQISVEDINPLPNAKTSPNTPKPINSNSITDNSNTNNNYEMSGTDEIEELIVETSPQNNCLPMGSLEAVRGLANKLSKIAVSDTDLRTCVLYALLEKNGMSVEETKKKLCSARTAITESLVLFANDTNPNSTPKRSISSVEPNDDLDETSTSDPIVYKAKKSFPKSVPNEIIKRILRTPLTVKTADISVQTIEPKVETNESNPSRASKMTTSPLIISPKILVSTQTQTLTPVPVVPTKLPTVPQIRKIVDLAPKSMTSMAPIITTSTPVVNPNLPTIMFMPLVNSSVNPNVSRFQFQMPSTQLPTQTTFTANQIQIQPSLSVNHMSTQSAFGLKIPANQMPIQSTLGIRVAANPVLSQSTLGVRLGANPLPIQSTLGVRVAANPVSSQSTLGIRFATNPMPTQSPISVRNVRPIGQQIILSATSANTKSVSINSGSIASLRPISPKVAENIRLSSMLRQPVSAFSTQYSNFCNNTPNKGVKRLKMQNFINTTNNCVQSDRITSVPKNLSSDMKTYSRVEPKESPIPTQPTVNSSEYKLCAKIITSEAALAALSAISDSNDSSFDNSKRNYDFDSNEEYILPDEDSMESENTVFIQPLNQFNQKRSLKTSNSYSPLIQSPTQVLLNSVNHSVSKPNSTLISSKMDVFNSNVEKEIIQITID